MAGIEVRDLCVQFDHHEPVLNHCSFDVQPGEIVALLGGSGSGKSTLLRTIAKLQSITSGEVFFTGEHPQRRAGDLSYVFQDATLLPWRTAQQNVRLPLELSRSAVPTTSEQREAAASRADEMTHRVHEALQAVGLPPESWNRYPRQLSGGMRMRVSWLAQSSPIPPSCCSMNRLQRSTNCCVIA